MDALTLAALCSLIVRHDAAPTAVPTGTNCAAVMTSAANNAAAAKRLVAGPADREAIARVAWAEAANQGDAGLAAVTYTIINRLGSGRFGASIDAVLNAPRQFEPVWRAGGDWRALRTLAEHAVAPPFDCGGPSASRVGACTHTALQWPIWQEDGFASPPWPQRRACNFLPLVS